MELIEPLTAFGVLFVEPPPPFDEPPTALPTLFVTVVFFASSSTSLLFEASSAFISSLAAFVFSPLAITTALLAFLAPFAVSLPPSKSSGIKPIL